MGTSPLWVLFAVAVYGVVHSWLASLGVKVQTRNWFGPQTERWYRLVYNAFAAVTLVPMLVTPLLLPDRSIYKIPMPWLVLSLGIQGLAGLALLLGLLDTGLWSFLGLSQLIQPQSEGTPKLVVRGLYRWVRHPLYSAGLVLIWLLPVMTVNLLALNLGLTLYIVIGAALEERKLVREFGDVYVEYQRRVPMLVPFLNGKWGGQ